VVNREASKADSERLGASAAVIIPASDVSIDERVWLKCLVSRCLRAGQMLNCPRHAPDLVRSALSRFSYAIPSATPDVLHK